MAKLSRKHGRTSVILTVFIADSTSTSGAGLTGLAYNSPGLTAYYYREHSTDEVAITLADMTLGTFTSGGFKEVDATNMPGVYAFCPPDLAFDNGSYSVFMMLKGAANMVPLPLEIDLEADVNVCEIAGHVVTGLGAVTVPSGTLAMTTNITAASGITLADGAITTAKIAAGAFTAAKFASDFFTSTATGVWDALTSALTTLGSIGKLIVDNLNATISSRASQTGLDNIPTVAEFEARTLVAANYATSSALTSAQGDITTLLDRLSSARAGYLDVLNTGGVIVATINDINALNQSASRRVVLQSSVQYERPESGSPNTYQIEVRTYDGDGAATNADTEPTLTATGIVSGSLAANLSAASNPATGVYRWTYSVQDDAALEQIRLDVSATIGGSTFTQSAYPQVVDLVAVTWTSVDSQRLQAVYDKLPSRDFLAGSSASTGAIVLADLGMASADLDTQLDAIAALINGLNDFDPTLDTVIVGQNNDKTGYALTAVYDQAKTAASQTSVNDVQTGVNAIASEVSTISSGVVGIATDVDTVDKILRADITIDTGTVPWEMVWKEVGTSTEIFRKKLKTTAGGSVTGTSTPIGQAVV